jgi:hypothetical protein
MSEVSSKVYGLFPLGSYFLPVFCGGIGFIGGFTIANRELKYSTIFSKHSNFSMIFISLFVDGGITLLQAMWYGIRGGLTGALIGTLIGSYLSKIR